MDPAQPQHNHSDKWSGVPEDLYLTESRRPRIDLPPVHVLVPVKKLDLCKSRLKHVLTDEARLQLVRAMITRVTSAVSAARVAARTAVVAPANGHHWDGLTGLGWDIINDGGLDLNGSLELGVNECVDRGASYVAIFPIDLVFVRPSNVRSVVTKAVSIHGHVIVPDSREIGTNALCMKVENRFPLRFGRRSMEKHLQAARASGVDVLVLRHTLLRYDLDTGEDLKKFAYVFETSRTRPKTSFSP